MGTYPQWGLFNYTLGRRRCGLFALIESRQVAQRAELPETDLVTLTPVVKSLATSLEVLPKRFEQALTLKATTETTLDEIMDPERAESSASREPPLDQPLA